MDGNVIIVALLHALHMGIYAFIVLSWVCTTNAAANTYSYQMSTTALVDNIIVDDDLSIDISAKTLCKLSEWPCSNGTCISLSKYCDGTYDCLDFSDEPAQCNGKYQYFYYYVYFYYLSSNI